MNLSRIRQPGRQQLMALLLFTAMSGVVSGQQAANVDAGQYISADRGLAIDQLVAAALDRSPAVQAARARVEAARGERVQAALRPNPGLTSEAREEIGGADRQTMIGLMWPLDLFRRPGRVEVGDQRVVVAEQEAAEVERELAANVRAGALRLLAAVRQWEVRSQVASTLSQFQELVAARAQSGATPPLERDVADVDARRSAADTIRQKAAVESALAELKATIGLPQDQPLLLRQTLEQLAAEADLSGRVGTTAQLEQSIAARPDIRRAEAQIRQASAELDLIRREARPDVSINAGYMRMSSGFPLFGLDAAGVRSPIHAVFHNVTVGATITLPWRDRRQGDIAAGTANARAARLDLDNRRLVAGAEIEAARARTRTLTSALEIYGGGLRALARKNVDIVQQSYQLGRATLLDVLAETRRLLETETAYTDLLVETLQARNDLASALGVIR